jgi:hypothetical protein
MFFLGDLTLTPKKQHQISCLESTRSEKARHIASERGGGEGEGGGRERERERDLLEDYVI